MLGRGAITPCGGKTEEVCNHHRSRRAMPQNPRKILGGENSEVRGTTAYFKVTAKDISMEGV